MSSTAERNPTGKSLTCPQLPLWVIPPFGPSSQGSLRPEVQVRDISPYKFDPDPLSPWVLSCLHSGNTEHLKYWSFLRLFQNTSWKKLQFRLRSWLLGAPIKLRLTLSIPACALLQPCLCQVMFPGWPTSWLTHGHSVPAWHWICPATLVESGHWHWVCFACFAQALRDCSCSQNGTSSYGSACPCCSWTLGGFSGELPQKCFSSINLLRPLPHMEWGSRRETTIYCSVKTWLILATMDQ